MKSVMCKVSKTCCGFYRLVHGYFHCGVKYFPLRQYNNSCFIGCNPVFHPLQVSSRLTAPFFDQNSLCIASQQEKQGSPQVYQMNVLCQRSSLIFPNMTGKYVCSDTNEHGRCPVFSFSLLPIGSQTITASIPFCLEISTHWWFQRSQ